MIGFFSLLAAQALPAALAPTGPWVMTTKDDGCQVVRDFGREGRVHLGFETQVTDRGRTMLFAGARRSLPEGIGEVAVHLGGQAPLALHYGAFELADHGLRLLKLFPDEAALESLTQADTVSIGDKGVPVQATGMREALAALDKCTSDLLSSWGADPSLYLRDKMAKLLNPARWFSSENYPREARARGASGRIVLLLGTRADGSIGDCKAVATADPSLNAGTCAIAFRYIRAKPPTDAEGHPIASYAILSVLWTNP